MESEIEEVEREPICSVMPASAATSQLLTTPRPAAAQISVSTQPDQLPTPLDPSQHPSRSSSAEELKPEHIPIVSPSTREQISGKQEEVISPLKQEYVKSAVHEDEAELGTEGTLPGYPSEAGLSALIGERIYDERMRAGGGMSSLSILFI